MLRRTLIFWMSDEKERTIALAVCLAAVLLYGLLFNVVLQRDLSEVSHEALVPAVLILLLWPILKDVASRVRNWSVPRRIAGSAVLIAVLMLVPLCLSIYAKAQIRTMAELPPQDFQKNLPKLEITLTAAANSSRVRDPAISDKLQDKFSKSNEDAPGFWPAAAAMINYRSVRAGGDLSDCLAKPSPHEVTFHDGLGPITVKNGQATFTVGPDVYENCRIELDSLSAQARYSEQLPIRSIVFRHCLVIYHGGIIMFPPSSVGSLVFTECTFAIETPPQPPQSGKTLLSSLLSAPNMSDVTVKLSGS